MWKEGRYNNIIEYKESRIVMAKLMIEDIVKRYPHLPRVMKENRVHTSNTTKVFQIIDDINCCICPEMVACENIFNEGIA